MRTWPEKLYYITHLSNIPSIMTYGILSRRRIKQFGLEFHDIADPKFVAIRDSHQIEGRSLSEFVNLFFQPTNPMLWRLLYTYKTTDLAIVEVNWAVSDCSLAHVSVGGVVAGGKIHPVETGLPLLKQHRRMLEKGGWDASTESKFQIQSECFISDEVPAPQISGLIFSQYEAFQHIRSPLVDRLVKVMPFMFFGGDAPQD